MLERCPKDDYSVTRFVLEQLAVRDVVACMTTGRRPSVLKHGAGDWFLEIEKWSRRGIEWESSERMFGLSRSMVMVMARVSSSYNLNSLVPPPWRKTRLI